MIKAILFDLDDTLLDRTASLEDFVQQQHQRYKLDHVPYAAYRSRFLELDRALAMPRSRSVFHSLISEFAVPASVEALAGRFPAARLE